MGSRSRAQVSAGMAALAAALMAACMGPGMGRPTGGPPGGMLDPDDRRYINPGTMAQEEGYSQAVRVGQVLYVSGQMALGADGQIVGRGDLSAQAAQVFANLSTVLRIAGAVPADIVRLTIYTTDAQRDWEKVRQAAPEFFPLRNPPAVTVLGVQSLGHDGALLAVEATAAMRGLLPERRPAVQPAR